MVFPDPRPAGPRVDGTETGRVLRAAGGHVVIHESDQSGLMGCSEKDPESSPSLGRWELPVEVRVPARKEKCEGPGCFRVCFP